MTALSRRRMMVLASALPFSGTRARAEAAGPNAKGYAMPTRGIIDVHSHYLPEFYAEALIGLGIGTPAIRGWTPEAHLRDMDEAGIEVGLLSAAQNTWYHDRNAARVMARRCNDYATQMARAHPGRFGVLVCTPLPFVDLALEEIAYGLDVLKCDGVGLYTSYGDKWLGDPAFAPVFEELDRRKALIHVHPMAADCCRHHPIPEIPEAAIELGTDTTRAIGQFIFNGSSQRYPNIRMIFSHGGGTMPFLVERFQFMEKFPQNQKLLPQGFLPEARRFFYDTAQCSNRTAMGALRSIVPVSQIVFGSDIPAKPSAPQVASLRSNGVFSPEDLRRIERENILEFLPRWRE